jgi:hypothetical protein
MLPVRCWRLWRRSNSGLFEAMADIKEVDIMVIGSRLRENDGRNRSLLILSKQSVNKSCTVHGGQLKFLNPDSLGSLMCGLPLLDGHEPPANK